MHPDWFIELTVKALIFVAGVCTAGLVYLIGYFLFN